MLSSALEPVATIGTHEASDGYRFRYRRYEASSPRAEVVCVHGIQSHGGWYEGSCRRLAEAGFNVSFLDRRGSGLNDQDRGDAPSFRRLLDDVAEFLRVKRGAPSAERETQSDPFAPLPVFLLAVSWGGKLAVALQRRHPGLVDGLALLCPGFCPRVRQAWRQRLAILGARLLAPRRTFPIPLDDPGLFTASPRWQQFLRDDPLALHRASARFLVESVRLDGYLRLAAKHVRVPVLLLLAEHDRIIDNSRTRSFARRFAGPTEVIEYPAAHHTLEFEPDPGRFLSDVVGWLRRLS
jgi:alpha-beta hydrolase superfamily lysophospholipase